MLAAGAACLTLIAATARLFLPAPSRLPMSLTPRWFAVAVAALALAALVGMLTRRLPLPRRGVLAAAWAGAAGLLLTAADGIAFDVIGVLMATVGQVTGNAAVVGIPTDWAGLATRVPALAAGALGGMAALAYRRRTAGACRCGRADGDAARAERFASLVAAARYAAYPAAALPLGYGGLKLAWGLGSTAGLTDPGFLGRVTFTSPGIGDTVALSGIGVLLALALVGGRTRLPRWIPIAAGWLGAAMLIPVGAVGAALTFAGPAHESPFTWWLTYGIYPWFLAWGVTLAAAVWSYQYRTRDACRACGRQRSESGETAM